MARRFVILAAFVATVLQALPSRSQEADGCFPDWSAAAPVVSKEGLATIEKLTRLAHGKVFGVIVKTELCRDKGGFVYRLVVREPSGRLNRVTVDARHPFED